MLLLTKWETHLTQQNADTSHVAHRCPATECCTTPWGSLIHITVNTFAPYYIPSMSLGSFRSEQVLFHTETKLKGLYQPHTMILVSPWIQCLYLNTVAHLYIPRILSRMHNVYRLRLSHTDCFPEHIDSPQQVSPYSTITPCVLHQLNSWLVKFMGNRPPSHHTNTCKTM